MAAPGLAFSLSVAARTRVVGRRPSNTGGADPSSVVGNASCTTGISSQFSSRDDISPREPPFRAKNPARSGAFMAVPAGTWPRSSRLTLRRSVQRYSFREPRLNVNEACASLRPSASARWISHSKARSAIPRRSTRTHRRRRPQAPARHGPFRGRLRIARRPRRPCGKIRASSQLLIGLL